MTDGPGDPASVAPTTLVSQQQAATRIGVRQPAAVAPSTAPASLGGVALLLAIAVGLLLMYALGRTSTVSLILGAALPVLGGVAVGLGVYLVRRTQRKAAPPVDVGAELYRLAGMTRATACRLLAGTGSPADEAAGLECLADAARLMAENWDAALTAAQRGAVTDARAESSVRAAAIAEFERALTADGTTFHGLSDHAAQIVRLVETLDASPRLPPPPLDAILSSGAAECLAIRTRSDPARR